MRRALACLMITALAAGCAAPTVNAPSLAPRTAEAIDPRVPIPAGVVAGPVSPALAARLVQLKASAGSSVGGFDAAADEARSAAAAAGPAQSESWIAAQQYLSALVAARAPVTRALGDLDALAADAVETRGGLLPGDRLAVEQAAAEIGAIDRRQAETVTAIAASLAP